MPLFTSDLKKGDWVRLDDDGGPVHGYVGRVVSLNARNRGHVRVSLRFDREGNRPDYKRTGAFVYASPRYYTKLHDLERLAFEAKEILR